MSYETFVAAASMTYGVDQCRRCGLAIRPRHDHGAADDRRPSKIPEPVWRAAGFKAQPTVSQAHFPQIGCCADCAEILLRQRWKPGLRMLMLVTILIVLMALIYFLAELFIP